MKNIDDLRRTYDEKEEAVTRQLETNLGESTIGLPGILNCQTGV